MLLRVYSSDLPSPVSAAHAWQVSAEAQKLANMLYQRQKHEGVVVIPILLGHPKEGVCADLFVTILAAFKNHLRTSLSINLGGFDDKYDETSKQFWMMRFRSIQTLFAEGHPWADPSKPWMPTLVASVRNALASKALMTLTNPLKQRTEVAPGGCKLMVDYIDHG